jgi:predicted Zn-dependent protease
MDYKIIVEKAKARGIDNVEINLTKLEKDTIETLNDSVQNIRSSSMDVSSVTFIIDNKKLFFYFEEQDFDIDELLDKAIKNAKQIDTEETSVFSDNKKKYPIEENKQITIDNSKIKENLYNLDKYAKSLDKKIINTELALSVTTRKMQKINSLGLEATRKEQNVIFKVSITVKEKENQYDTSKIYNAKNIEEIDFKKIVKQCAEEVLFKIGEKPIKSGNYEIILDKKVTAQMLQSMMPFFGAEKINKGGSPLKDELNKKIISSKLTLIEDPNNNSFLYKRYFDDEGVGTKYKEIIKNGVLQKNVCSLFNSFAIISIRPSSASLSTFIIKISNSSASLILLSVLPTPLKIILYFAIPAFNARLTSPILTQSAPAPWSPKCFTTLKFEFALTA